MANPNIKDILQDAKDYKAGNAAMLNYRVKAELRQYKQDLLGIVKKIKPRDNGTFETAPRETERIQRQLYRLKAQLQSKGMLSAWNQLIMSTKDLVMFQELIYKQLGVNVGMLDYAVDYSAIMKTDYEGLPYPERVLKGIVDENQNNAQRFDNEMRKLFQTQYFDENAKFTDLVEGIEAKFAKFTNWSYTLANTGLQMTDRAINREIAESVGVRYYKYFGGVINSTRKFCRDILAGTHPNTGLPHENKYTASEIAAMDNRQGEGVRDVFVSGGGYNCRHQWFPVIDGNVDGKFLI